MNEISVAQIIAHVETGNNPHELRFEPATYSALPMNPPPAKAQILVNIAHLHHCSSGTARMIYSTSWGKYQMMGFNLYGMLGYQGNIFQYAEDDAAQDQTFERFVTLNKIVCTVDDFKDPAKRAHFAQVYNGNPDAYSAMILIAMHALGVAV